MIFCINFKRIKEREILPALFDKVPLTLCCLVWVKHFSTDINYKPDQLDFYEHVMPCLS
jgi:hypothetical protein